jgi:hypothetical protein
MTGDGHLFETQDGHHARQVHDPAKSDRLAPRRCRAGDWQGIDRDELIDWYLEMKEEEIQDVDELEYEKELVTKVLRKLVKVRSLRCYVRVCD